MNIRMKFDEETVELAQRLRAWKVARAVVLHYSNPQNVAQTFCTSHTNEMGWMVERYDGF